MAGMERRNPPFILRRAAPDDAEAIADCHREAVTKKAAAFYGADLIDEWAWSADRLDKIRGEIQNQDYIYLVATSGDCILGYGIANPSGLELKSLCARPNKKGRVGTALLAALLDQCKNRGCAYLDSSSSLNAEKFYLQHGFRVLQKGQHIMESGHVMQCIKMRIVLHRSENPSASAP